MFKYFFMGCGAIILLIAFIKYLMWTIPIIKHRFFTRYTNEEEEYWSYVDFDEWCFPHKLFLIWLCMVIVTITFFLFMDSLGIITIK